MPIKLSTEEMTCFTRRLIYQKTDEKMEAKGDDTCSVSSSHESAWSDAEDEVYEFKAFHDDSVFDSMTGMLQHEKSRHGFDLAGLRKSCGLDLYGTIKLVNFMRKSPTVSQDTVETRMAEILGDERYLKPTLENDAVLYHLVEDDDDDGDGREDSTIVGGGGRQGGDAAKGKSTDEGEEWKEKFARLQSQHELLQQAMTLRMKAETDTDGKASDNDAYYFESYGYNDIHETMLKDAIRTDAYRDAVYDNKDIFQGKTVLDVGCGTGILSMFCAKAGAKHVYAIDNSNIIDKARSNAYENDLDDKITFIKGKVEEIELPVPEVDIIISEWMGYALLYESMLDSVLCARDRFLAPAGLMMPSVTTMLIAGISDKDYFDDRVNFWSDVYGFRMGAMKDGIFDNVLIDSLAEKSLGTRPAVFESLDIHTVTVDDLVFKRPFNLQVLPGQDSIVAFQVWFDTFFTRARQDSALPQEPMRGSVKTTSGNAFSTGPYSTATHWKQAVLLLDGEIKLSDDEEIVGQIEYQKGSPNPRYLEIVVSWSVRAKSSEHHPSEYDNRQGWHLS